MHSRFVARCSLLQQLLFAFLDPKGSSEGGYGLEEGGSPTSALWVAVETPRVEVLLARLGYHGFLIGYSVSHTRAVLDLASFLSGTDHDSKIVSSGIVPIVGPLIL